MSNINIFLQKDKEWQYVIAKTPQLMSEFNSKKAIANHAGIV